MIRKFFASIFVGLFLIFSSFAVLLFALNDTFLDFSFYEEELLSEFYELGMDLAIDKAMDENPVLKDNFSKEEAGKLVKQVFPYEVLETGLSDIISQVSEIDLESTEPQSLKISFKDFKSNVSEIAPEVIGEVLDKLPQCEKDMTPLEEGEIPDCLPPGTDPAQLKNQLIFMLENEFLNTIPDVYEATLPDAEEIEANDADMALFVMKNSSFIMFNFLLLLMVAIGLILFKPFYRTMFWEGWMLVFAGISNGALAYFIRIAPAQVDSSMVEGDAARLVEVLKATTGLFSRSMFSYCVAFLVAGLLFIFIGRFLKDKN
jgi:hypothetical protein